MNKYEITKIGEFHSNYNEDFLVSNEIGDSKVMVAVMDGCTMGTDSHFASTLIGKLLKKISREIHYKEFINKQEDDLKQTLQEIIYKLFEQLKELKNRISLEIDELLSTLILGIINHKNKTAEIITIGDGLISYNGKLIEYDQGDKPDYLGYHLNKDFKEWYEGQKQRLSLNQIEDLSMLTDGIFTFKKFDKQEYPEINESEIIDFLLVDKTGNENENMLKKKIIEIEREWGLKPTDDLTIIRVISD